MNDTIHKLENGDFETESFRRNQTLLLKSRGPHSDLLTMQILEEAILSPEDRLKVLYAQRLRLYKKGGNDESLNDEIRSLQVETNYKIKE